jgi:hypothetical protein
MSLDTPSHVTITPFGQTTASTCPHTCLPTAASAVAAAGCCCCRRTFVSPDKPSHVTISLWTDDRWHLPPHMRFGGPLNTTGGPYPSRFKNLRRVLCDAPLPAGAAAAGLAVRGPSWLY